MPTPVQPLRPASSRAASARRAALGRAALGALALLGLAACTRPEGALPPGVSVEDLPDQETWDARLDASVGSDPELAMRAPYAAHYDRPDTTYTYLGPAPGAADSLAERPAVELTLYADAQPTATVRAVRAWLYERSGDLEAVGRVTADVTAGDGARLQAARLTVADGGAFRASGGTVADFGGRNAARVRARTLAGTLEGSRYTAEGDVTVDAGGRTLTAGRVVWDGRRFRAPGAFSFVGPGERVRGVGLVATADLSRYSFSRAQGQIEVQE